MYPRYAFLSEVFSCEVIAVESAQYVQILTSETREAYAQLQTWLEKFYVRDAAGVPLTLEQLRIGVSVIVMDFGGPMRGEIVYCDDQGYSDVLLVDEGRRAFYKAHYLYEATPLCATVAALCAECRVVGLPDALGVAEILDEVCRGQNLTGEVVARRHDGPPEIRLLNRDLQNIAHIVLQRYGADFDLATDDEGFIEGDDEEEV